MRYPCTGSAGLGRRSLAVGPVRRRLVTWGRRWYRLDSRWLVRPDQQHGTWGVVDNEASGRAQAVRPETRTVAVSGHHEKLDVLCDGTDNFALDPSPTMEKFSVLPPEPLCRGFQDRRGRLVRDFLEVAGGPAAAQARPSSPALAASVTAPTSEGETWRSATCASGGTTWAAASRHPFHVPSTSQTTTLTGTSSHQSQ